MKWIKTGLVALLLSTTGVVFGQTSGTIEKGPLNLGPFSAADAANRATALGTALVPAYEEANVVLFYNPDGPNGSGLTLVASRTEDFTGITPTPSRDALEFTHYRWTYMGEDNTTAVSGEAFAAGLVEGGLLNPYTAAGDEKLTVTNLTEGYHYFSVQGYIVPDGADLDETCLQYSETFVVFVLPRLTVAADHTGGATGLLQYCETDAADQTAVTLEANVAYDEYEGEPALSGFELKYTWYAVKADENGDYATIDDNKQDITSAVEQVSNDVTSATNSFSPTIAEIGKYKFFVEVEYTLKARDYDGAETDDDRKRTYALYRGWVGGTDQASASEIIVTPAPGKPHITIEEVID